MDLSEAMGTSFASETSVAFYHFEQMLDRAPSCLSHYFLEASLREVVGLRFLKLSDLSFLRRHSFEIPYLQSQSFTISAQFYLGSSSPLDSAACDRNLHSFIVAPNFQPSS